MALSTPSGPSSRNERTPCSSSQRTASPNRTARRACATQWSGSASSCTVAGSPVSVDTSGSSGSCGASPATTARNSSSIGSISGEWNAWLTVSRFALRPDCSKCSATATASSASPEITTARGPLTAASET
ncbi:hypothetical protein GCM10027271_23030 [Saccharopolyspora gloriosae]